MCLHASFTRRSSLDSRGGCGTAAGLSSPSGAGAGGGAFGRHLCAAKPDFVMPPNLVAVGSQQHDVVRGLHQVCVQQLCAHLQPDEGTGHHLRLRAHDGRAQGSCHGPAVDHQVPATERAREVQDHVSRFSLPHQHIDPPVAVHTTVDCDAVVGISPDADMWAERAHVHVAQPDAAALAVPNALHRRKDLPALVRWDRGSSLPRAADDEVLKVSNVLLELRHVLHLRHHGYEQAYQVQ